MRLELSSISLARPARASSLAQAAASSLLALAALSFASCSREPPPPLPGQQLEPLRVPPAAHIPPGSPAAPPPPSPFAASLDAGPRAPLTPLRDPHSGDHFTAEACADAWLTRHSLNPYGDPPGTLYPGGTPLFDERTGRRTERLTWLFGRHADLRADCAPRPGAP